MLELRAALDDDRGAISKLRRTALASSGEFVLNDLHSADWCADDDVSAVLTIWDDDVAVASMRVSIAGDFVRLNRWLGYEIPQQSLKLPVLVMTRAASLPSHAKSGLQGVLRFAYLHAAKAASAEHVLAVVYEGAPRVRSMQQAGFRMETIADFDDREARVLAKPLAAVLDRSEFEFALRITETTFAEAIASVRIDWIGIHRRFLAMAEHHLL